MKTDIASSRSPELLKRLHDHEFSEGDADSSGECEECRIELTGPVGLYRKTSYEYDEYQCLCERCCVAKMDDDERMWKSMEHDQP